MKTLASVGSPARQLHRVDIDQLGPRQLFPVVRRWLNAVGRKQATGLVVAPPRPVPVPEPPPTQRVLWKRRLVSGTLPDKCRGNRVL